MQPLKRLNPEDRGRCPCSDGGYYYVTEDSIDIFLGVEVSKNINKINLRQSFLIGRIIEVVRFQDTRACSNPPSSTENLTKDKFRTERKYSWAYHPVVLMLNYL